jgi:hypothetical protein
MSLPRLIVPKRHPDARGWFAETYNEARLRALGIDCRLGRCLRVGLGKYYVPVFAIAKFVPRALWI